MSELPQTKSVLGQLRSSEQESSKGETVLVSGQRLWVILSLVIVYLIWGSTYLAIRFAIVSIPPFLMVGIRFLIAGGLLYLFLRLRGVAAPKREQWLGSTFVGLFLLGGGMGGVAFAEQWVSSSVAALCIATTPLWISLFSGLWGRWPVRLEWVGLALGLLGVVLLNLGSKTLLANPIGAIALFCAPLCWAFGSAWSHHLSLPEGLMGSAAEMLVGGTFLTLLGLVLGERITSLPTMQSFWAFLYLIIFGSLIAFSAYGYLLRTVRPALATSYAYVNPMVAVCLGVLLAGEQFTWIAGIAMLVILAGVVLVSLARERVKRA